MKKSFKTGIIITISALTLIAIIFFVIFKDNFYKINITQSVFEIEAGVPLDYLDIITCDKDAAIELLTEQINVLDIGTHELVFRVTYKNKITDFPVKIEVVDTTPPDLTIVNRHIPWMSEPDLLSEDYVTILDNADDSPLVEILENDLNPQKSGTYNVTYQVTDHSGNSNTINVTYDVEDGLPQNTSDRTKELYGLVQGNWKDTSYSILGVRGTSMLHFEGDRYIYRDSNGNEYGGKYTVSEFIKSEWESDGSLFCIDLSPYAQQPTRLFYYENDSRPTISDIFAKQHRPFEYSTYRKSYAKLTDFDKLEKEQPVEPAIGMTKDEVIDSSWGEPKTKNITETKYSIYEQWCYSTNNYIYFENGIVTSIQRSGN